MKKMSSKAPAGETVSIKVRLSAEQVARRDALFKKFSIPSGFYLKLVAGEIADEKFDESDGWWQESFTYPSAAAAAKVARRLFRDDDLRRSVSLFHKTRGGGMSGKCFMNPACEGMTTQEYDRWRVRMIEMRTGKN